MEPGLQFQTLPMFMSGKELRSLRPHDQGHLGGTPQEFWERKRQRGIASGLAADIRANGVDTPVRVRHMPGQPSTLSDGHHRAAAVGDNQLVPVHHYDFVAETRPGRVKPKPSVALDVL